MLDDDDYDDAADDNGDNSDDDADDSMCISISISISVPLIRGSSKTSTENAEKMKCQWSNSRKI